MNQNEEQQKHSLGSEIYYHLYNMPAEGFPTSAIAYLDSKIEEVKRNEGALVYKEQMEINWRMYKKEVDKRSWMSVKEREPLINECGWIYVPSWGQWQELDMLFTYGNGYWYSTADVIPKLQFLAGEVTHYILKPTPPKQEGV